jgi:hypothetical protein
LDLDKIVADLKKERDRVIRAITALVGEEGWEPASTATHRKRGVISEAGRKRLSVLMKQRWAEKNRRKKG